jgi:hypothetical protein
VEGFKREIGVVTNQSIDKNDYVFAEWLHGGNSTQMITTPEDDITYTASFDLVLATDEIIDGIYPNPANDWIYLRHKEITGVSITDLVGRTYNVPIESQSEIKVVDVRLIPAGFYLLNFSLSNSFVRKKILIQR